MNSALRYEDEFRVTIKIFVICGQYKPILTMVRDLSLAIDSDLSMELQMAKVCRSAYYCCSSIARKREHPLYVKLSLLLLVFDIHTGFYNM